MGIALNARRKLFETFLDRMPERSFAVRFWDDAEIPAQTEKPRFTLILSHPDALRTLTSRPDFRTLGESFLREELDVEGDLEAIYDLAEQIVGGFKDSPAEKSQGAEGLHPFRSQDPEHSKRRDAEAISYHYDLSNAMYEKILDPTMVYSSAYYHSPDDDLESAQTQKLDRVCRKLGLKKGERLLDIGCGWGGMISHAARQWEAKAEGITISREQQAYCAARFEREEIDARAQVIDYRDLGELGTFDKVVSLGMVEHVGVAQLAEYFAVAWEALAPGGLFLLQGVASSATEKETAASEFATGYVFPDADMPYLWQYIESASRAGFEVRDVEDLREHYALTHRAWRQNLEQNREEIVAEIGEEQYRALRLMYSYSTHYFFAHKCAIYQILLLKPAQIKPAQGSRDLFPVPLLRAL